MNSRGPYAPRLSPAAPRGEAGKQLHRDIVTDRCEQLWSPAFGPSVFLKAYQRANSDGCTGKSSTDRARTCHRSVRLGTKDGTARHLGPTCQCGCLKDSPTRVKSRTGPSSTTVPSRLMWHTKRRVFPPSPLPGVATYQRRMPDSHGQVARAHQAVSPERGQES